MKLKKWHLILIGILILGFAVTEYIFVYILKPASNIAFLIYDFLDKWASAGAPAITLIGIVVALIIGIRSLQQTENIQKQEQRQRLLNEIIEWASDLANVAFGHEMITVPREEEIRDKLIDLGNKVFRYQAIDARSPYIAKCAQVFGKELHTAVLTVVSCRNDVGLKIDKCFHNFEDKDNKEALDASEHELRNRALELIELVAKIKTKDIS